MDKIIALIKEFIEKKMYGSIVIKFEAGKMVNVQKTESVKVT
jgi:hypothetical protein